MGKVFSNCTECELLFLQHDNRSSDVYVVECEKYYSHTVSQVGSNNETRCHSCKCSPRLCKEPNQGVSAPGAHFECSDRVLTLHKNGSCEITQ